MKFVNKISVISLIVLMFSFMNVAQAVNAAHDDNTNSPPPPPACDSHSHKGTCSFWTPNIKNYKVNCGLTYEFYNTQAYTCQWKEETHDFTGKSYPAGCFRTKGPCSPQSSQY
jgi:hypothetical protein